MRLSQPHRRSIVLVVGRPRAAFSHSGRLGNRPCLAYHSRTASIACSWPARRTAVASLTIYRGQGSDRGPGPRRAHREVLEQLHVRNQDLWAAPSNSLSSFGARRHLQTSLHVDDGAGLQVVDDQVGETAHIRCHASVSSGILVDRRSLRASWPGRPWTPALPQISGEAGRLR
jgi:hypothetical protein